MNIIKNNIIKLPRDVQLLIYTYTDEMARKYARHLGFINFGARNNQIFTNYYYKTVCNLNLQEANRLWVLEYKLINILKEKQNYFNFKKRPCLQHSYNSKNDFKENVYPEYHDTISNIWAIDNYKTLISYALKISLDGYYTILFIKQNHLQTFRKRFTKRIVDHHMRKHIDKYIVYYNNNFKKFDDKIKGNKIPRIICIPYDCKKINNIKLYIELLYYNNIKSHILYPESSNNKTNKLISSYFKYTNGAGKYNIVNND